MSKKEVGKYALYGFCALGLSWGAYSVLLNTANTATEKHQQQYATQKRNKIIAKKIQEFYEKDASLSEKVKLAQSNIDTETGSRKKSIDNLSKGVGELTEDTKWIRKELVRIEDKVDDVATRVDATDKINKEQQKVMEGSLNQTRYSLSQASCAVEKRVKQIETILKETLPDAGPMDVPQQQKNYVASVEYVHGQSIQSIGFSVQSPQQDALTKIEKVIAAYSLGMKKTEKRITKNSTRAVVERTEILYTGDDQRHLLILEQAGDTAYVSFKLDGNNEIPALQNMVTSCCFSLGQKAKEQMQQLTKTHGDEK